MLCGFRLSSQNTDVTRTRLSHRSQALPLILNRCFPICKIESFIFDNLRTPLNDFEISRKYAHRELLILSPIAIRSEVNRGWTGDAREIISISNWLSLTTSGSIYVEEYGYAPQRPRVWRGMLALPHVSAETECTSLQGQSLIMETNVRVYDIENINDVCELFVFIQTLAGRAKKLQETFRKIHLAAFLERIQNDINILRWSTRSWTSKQERDNFAQKKSS